jgi:dienelactone hydrolase
LLLTVLLASCASTERVADDAVPRESLRVQLSAGAVEVDVYLPAAAEPTPLVIVAHGFSRSRRNMAGWGQQLAAAGYLAVVPDLPSRSDHAGNGRSLTELRQYLLEDAAWRVRIDPARIGLLGFSAGGLSSLVSAAQAPAVAIWVGLDPVDRGGLAVRAAEQFRGDAVVITAEPSACNARGNAHEILAALPRHTHFHVDGAVHVDAEWPGSWDGEFACGRSSDEGRAAFRRLTMQAFAGRFSRTADLKRSVQEASGATASSHVPEWPPAVVACTAAGER